MEGLRNPETTKHDYGHALLVAGAHSRMGCAILAARAALRSGCGLLTVHLPSLCVDPMQAAFPEAMVSLDPDDRLFTAVPGSLDRYAAVAVGPGIGTAEVTRQALRRLLQAVNNPNRPSAPSHFLSLPFTPLILDADALNILSLHRDWLPLAQGAVLTPHAGEYRRLFGDADPAEMAARHNVVIVRKAHRTHVYSPDGQEYVNQTGNAAMATAGSGDVLTGIMLGMLSSNRLHASVFDIVCRAVAIHGELGDRLAQKQSQSSLIASDLVDELRCVSTDIPAC